MNAPLLRKVAKRIKENPVKIPDFGTELFELVHTDQGMAFISDSIEGVSIKDVIKSAEISIFYTERSLIKLRRFLKKYRHLIKTGE